MIDIAEIVTRAQLAAVHERIRESRMVRELAMGLYEPKPDEILPPFPTEPTAYAAALAAWRRIRQQVGSAGPKAISNLINATLGDLNWSNRSDVLDEAMQQLNLEALAYERMVDLLCDGITAGYAYRDPQGNYRMTALGGYLEPFWSETNRDVLEGLYQADSYLATQGTQTVVRWFVRFYDWSEANLDGTIMVREWRNLASPTALSSARVVEIPNHPPLRYRIVQRTPEGYPIGIMTQAAPLLLSLMATEYRLVRLEEYAAHPVPVFEDGRVQSVGPGLPVAGPFRWERPGDLTELRAQRETKLEAIRDFLGLTGGLLGAGNTPSGEALQEANQRLYQTASRMARTLASFLTELCRDYTILTRLPDPGEITITPNRDYIRQQVIDSTIALYDKGLLPLEVAARNVQPFFNWPDEEFNRWVTQQTQRITPDEARAQIEAALNQTPEQ